MRVQVRGAAPRQSGVGVVRRSMPWQLLRGTVSACLRYRVTGLAAEGAFFAILSLPPLVFGLAGSIGYVVGGFGSDTVEDVKAGLVGVARGALTEASIQNVIVPTLDAVLDHGRPDVISIGFVLALWSGSRALNVFIDTIAIMHGLGGRRGIVKTRVLSFSLYVVALGVAVLVMPLVLAGPSLVRAVLPERLEFLTSAYWPVVVGLSTAFLSTLYHLAVPKRTPWRHDFTGAIVAMGMWVGGSYLLRWVLSQSIGGTSIYGPLAAPIAVLLWLYVIVISLLIGAAFSATFHGLLTERAAARRRPAVRRLEGARETDRLRQLEAGRRAAAERRGANGDGEAETRPLAAEPSRDA